MSTDNAISKIEAQQQGKKGTSVWYVGEQLKDICRENVHNADIVSTDLDNPDMSIEKCERKIEEYARNHKSGNCGCCPPDVADRIIREFYGIPTADDSTPAKQPDLIDLADFM